MVEKYIPDRGDVVLLNFNPQSGREQSGLRPAIVLSPKIYNEKTGLAIFCPITNKIKGYPFEILLPNSLKTKGVVLVDHVKSLDWRIRIESFLEKLPVNVINDIVSKLKLLIG